MSGTALRTTDRFSLHVVGRLDGPLVLVIAKLQLHTRLCIVEEAEYVRRALREARGTGLWIGVEGGRRIKYVLRVTPFEGRSRIRAWYETTREAERLKISEARRAGELGRVIIDGAILRVLAAHDRYWRESITTLEAIEDSEDEEDFEMFYGILELSAMRLRVAVALTSLKYYTDDLIAVWDDFIPLLTDFRIFHSEISTGTAGLARRMGELEDWMITRAVLAMRPMGVEAILEAGGSQIRAGETGTEIVDMRDRTEMDIGTTDMRGRIEMDTGVAGMREEIETGTDKMTRAVGMTAGDSRGRSVTIRGGGTIEEIDAMSHAGDTTMGTVGMTHGDDMSKEDPEETAAMIRAAGTREGDMLSADERPPTPRNSCVYCRGDDHIKRDCPDLKRAIDEGLVVLDDRKYVKWEDDPGDVSMFPSMNENVEARRVKPSKRKEPVRSQSIKITFEGDTATTPIRVAATKSARGSTSKKTDTDYVMAEKDGQRIDGEEVNLSPRKEGGKKFLMKSSLYEIDTVEPLRRVFRQPMQCSILEYMAASKPARDELQMITRKTRIPLSEEAQVASKADARTVAVS
ncbi:hypothetical protein CBR_g57135 [Chara braunii]|uniref:CCHC-type domain-containing protein n=1 Tax=Chara braunii TaxID=69332 RepID=A0A388ME59_CHABU|nr:hypothetical protein CBR_g57135 [Chara braunii]|eukprot:GBG92785.1 hypothetical protein CBR_g57135 [Chara braunii]